MSFLKKKMCISGMPLAAKAAPMTFDGPIAVDDEASHHPHDKFELSNYYDDYNHDDDDDDLQEKQKDSYQGEEEEEEEEPEHVDYDELLQQAAQWKATMQGALDTVYKLRIESAMTLDTFAMMYPASSHVEHQGNDDEKQNAATAAESHRQ